MKRRAARKQAKGGRRQAVPRATKSARPDPDLMTRTSIARKARLDRDTVRRYLAIDGAPKQRRRGLFSFKEVIGWVERNAPRLATNTDEMRTIKQSILRMEAEDMAIDLAVKRLRFIDKAKIEPAIASFMGGLTDDLLAKFEQELPPKYEGKTTAERAKLNAEAVDWIIARIKSGAAPISRA